MSTEEMFDTQQPFYGIPSDLELETGKGFGEADIWDSGPLDLPPSPGEFGPLDEDMFEDKTPQEQEVTLHAEEAAAIQAEEQRDKRQRDKRQRAEEGTEEGGTKKAKTDLKPTPVPAGRDMRSSRAVGETISQAQKIIQKSQSLSGIRKKIDSILGEEQNADPPLSEADKKEILAEITRLEEELNPRPLRVQSGITMTNILEVIDYRSPLFLGSDRGEAPPTHYRNRSIMFEWESNQKQWTTLTKEKGLGRLFSPYSETDKWPRCWMTGLVVQGLRPDPLKHTDDALYGTTN